MGKRSLIEELDRAVEEILRNPGATQPEVDSRIAPLIRIAVDLRDLATDEFQTRLEQELLGSLQHDPSYRRRSGLNQQDGALGATLAMTDQRADLLSQTTGFGLEPRDVAAALDSLDNALVDSYGRSVRILASLDECIVGVARYSHQTPLWTRNPNAEELIHVLEGALDVTSLTDAGPVHTSVPAGSIFVCQRDVWHRQRPSPTASLLFVTPEKGTQHSQSELPVSYTAPSARPGRRPSRSAGPQAENAESQPKMPAVAALNVRAALSGIPVLAISDKTTGEEAAAAFPQLGSLNGCGLYAGRFSGLSPWERHTSADELLHVLEGELEITTLTDAGAVRNTLRAGTVFVCPRGLWHRQYSAGGVLEFSATPQPTEVSFVEDPRV